MTIIEQLSDAGASGAQLAELEAAIGAKLPADYRAFLADFNGGRPDPSGFDFESSNGPSGSRVRYFLTLDEREDFYNVKQFLDLYHERIPEGLLPIGCDSFGNLLLLDLSGRSYGSVYFWDHELEDMHEPTMANVSVITDSFSEFVKILL